MMRAGTVSRGESGLRFGAIARPGGAARLVLGSITLAAALLLGGSLPSRADEIAAVTTYIRVSWGNSGLPVTAKEANAVRSSALD